MSTPASRLERILSEGGRFSVLLPGQTSIDVTADIVALIGGVQIGTMESNQSRNLLEANDLGRDVATRVHFP